LVTKRLGKGVYALISSRPPVDNSGFIVGEKGVLVIDAHFNGRMARKIQAAVREVTDKPILYLVNTNFHGDHTFGNHAFPRDTTIVAHRKTAEIMRRFDEEKQFLLGTVKNDQTVYGDAVLRLPDLTFDDRLTIDLGGRVVEIHHFGHGNTPGDTVVYEPTTRTAWTGNLVLGNGTIPWALDGDMPAYLETIGRFAARLDVATIISGHTPPVSGAILGKYQRYINELLVAVRGAVRSGHSLDQTLAALALDESYLPVADSPLAQLRPIMQGFHRWNVKKTYLEQNGR
jgi:cyclase